MKTKPQNRLALFIKKKKYTAINPTYEDVTSALDVDHERWMNAQMIESNHQRLEQN